MKKVLFIFLLAVIGFTGRSLGQNNSNSAYIITLNDSISSMNVTVTDTELWFKFVAPDTNIIASINFPQGVTIPVTNIALYKKESNSLVLIQENDSATGLFYDNNTSNDTSYIKISFLTTYSNSINFSVVKAPPYWGIGARQSSLGGNFNQCINLQENQTCTLISLCYINQPIDLQCIVPSDMLNYPYAHWTYRFKCDGVYISPSNPIINTGNPSSPYPYITTTLTTGIHSIELEIYDPSVSPWSGQLYNIVGPTWGNRTFIVNVYDSPNSNILDIPSQTVCVGTNLCLIKPQFLNLPHTINWGGLSVYNTISGQVCTNSQCPGTYYISATVNNECGNSTTNYTLKISTMPEIIADKDEGCIRTEFLFNGITCLDNNPNLLANCTYSWDFGDGNTSNQKNTSHIYSSPGTYIVKFSVRYNNQTGCDVTEYVTKTIIVHQPDKPIIEGNNSNCNRYENHYTIQNFNPNYTYTWSLSLVNGVKHDIVNGEISIDWNENITDECPVEIINVQVEDEYKCTNSSTFLVYKCCDNNSQAMTYTSITTFNGTQTINNPLHYVFNEDVIIDGDIEFRDIFVHMAPNTKIIVNPGAKFKVINTTISTLIDCCNDMWDGIYVEVPSAQLYIDMSSIIQNAQNAVVSRNKGFISLLNSTFSDNYRNVVIEDFNLTMPYDFTPYPATIKACTFKGNASYLLLHAPYLGVQTYTGIETKNILNLTIGDFTDPAFKNTFEKMYCGIKGVNSNLYIFNNDFKDIRLEPSGTLNSFGSDPTVIYQPTAIHSIFNNSLLKLNLRELVIGGLTDPYKPNTISNSVNGIYSYSQRVDIRGNTIEAEKYGIRDKDILDNSWISSNVINSTSLFIFTGIEVLNIQPTYVNLTINDNIVFPEVKGISIANCLSEPRSGQYNVFVYNNHVFFHRDNYYANVRDRSGILSNNCTAISISCNEVARLLANEPNFLGALFGINIIQTRHAQIKDNFNLNKMGAGINVYGDCNYTLFNCNVLKYSYHGFLFNHLSSITQQGSDGVNTDNYFEGDYLTGSQTYRKFWSISPNLQTINWHVRNNMPWNYWLDNYNFMNPTSNIIIEVQNLSNAISSCADCQTGSIEEGIHWNPEKREEIYGKVVRNEISYDTLNTEFTTYDQELLYRLLKEDSSLMNMGDTSDIAYQQFYSNNQNSNIGKIVETQELIKTGEITQAITKNEAVQDQKMIDYYMREVNAIYLKTYAIGNYQLTTQQIVFLTTVANITPWEGGDAVYIARYMLDIDENLLTVDFVKAPKANEQLTKANSAKLYPNPAANEVMIEFDKAISGNAQLEIYGFAGNLIHTTTLASGHQFISISIKDLKPGIYLYRILQNNEVMAKEKLVIIK